MGDSGPPYPGFFAQLLNGTARSHQQHPQHEGSAVTWELIAYFR